LVVLLTWSGESSIKFGSEQNANKLSVEVTDANKLRLICIKLGVFVLFVTKKNRGRRINKGEREDGRSLDHKLNIIQEFVNEFNR